MHQRVCLATGGPFFVGHPVIETIAPAMPYLSLQQAGRS